MHKAAKEKTFSLLLAIAPVVLLCAPAIASSERVLAPENRAELFLLGAENGTGQQPFHSAKHVENDDPFGTIALESLVAPNPGVVGEFAEGAATQVKIQGNRVYALQPSNGGSGPLRWTRTNRQTATSTHGNSLSNSAETHVYVIRDPQGRAYKIGESAQGVRVGDGASIRAEQQVRDLIRQNGPGYTSEIRRTFPGGKAPARTYETNFIERFRRMFGDDQLPGNLTNR